MIQGQSKSSHPRRCAGRVTRLQLVLLVGMALLCSAGGVGYWLWSIEPEHWTDNQAFLESHSEDEIQDLAAKAEQRFTELSNFFQSEPLIQPTGNRTQARHNKADSGSDNTALPDAAQADPNRPITRSMAFTTQEINAWLNQRAPDWLANRGTPMPANVSRPMVAIQGEQMVAAFKYSSPEVEQVVSMFFDVKIDEQGKAQLKLNRIQGGNLPLPVEKLSQRLAGGDDASESVKKLAAMFEGQAFDPVWDVDKTRQARLLAFKPTAKGVEVTVRTQPKK